MESVKRLFDQINDNSMNIQNLVGGVAGLILFVFALWTICGFLYMVGSNGSTWYHISEQVIKIGNIILWVCAVLLLVFGSVNIYKGHTVQGLVAIAFGLLWVVAVVFSVRLDFSMGDGAINLCMSANKWNVAVKDNLIKNWWSGSNV